MDYADNEGAWRLDRATLWADTERVCVVDHKPGKDVVMP